MMKDNNIFEQCLYFTSARLSRIATKIAEDAFARSGMTPTYAFLMMMVRRKPGISPTELAEKLYIAPSTVTRLVDKLVVKGLLTRTVEGKNCHVHLTEAGINIQRDLKKQWANLHDAYAKILGEEGGNALAQATNEAAKKLEGN